MGKTDAKKKMSGSGQGWGRSHVPYPFLCQSLHRTASALNFQDDPCTTIYAAASAPVLESAHVSLLCVPLYREGGGLKGEGSRGGAG